MKNRMLPVFVILGATILVFASAFFVSAAGPAVYWHPANNGLATNDIEALAVAPISPTVLYAGTWGDGVFRSTDNGATWITATHGLTLPFYVNGALALAVSPVASGTVGLDQITVYAGDYYGGLPSRGVYRSQDGGQSWSLVLPGAGTRAIAVDPITPTIVYVGDRENGIYRSLNSGDTWNPANAGLGDTRVNALAAGGKRLYAGAYTYVFTSTTHGASWTLAHTFSSTVQAVAAHPFTPTLLFAGTRSNGLYRSTDGGQTWTQLENGLPSSVWVTSLSIAPGVAYAGAWNGQVYRSADLGDSWEGLGYLGNVYAVLAHPNVPDIVYAGTSNNGVFRGSALDHLTIDPIDSPQYVNRSFPITLTARDALSFPLAQDLSGFQNLTGLYADPALAETLAAGGYNGTAILTDTAGLVSPTVVSLANGVGTLSLVFGQPIANDVITATLQTEGLQAVGNPFEVRWYARIYLPAVMKTQ